VQAHCQEELQRKLILQTAVACPHPGKEKGAFPTCQIREASDSV